MGVNTSWTYSVDILSLLFKIKFIKVSVWNTKVDPVPEEQVKNGSDSTSYFVSNLELFFMYNADKTLFLCIFSLQV